MLAYARNYSLMALPMSLSCLPFWGKACFEFGLLLLHQPDQLVNTLQVLHFHPFVGCMFPFTVRSFSGKKNKNKNKKQMSTALLVDSPNTLTHFNNQLRKQQK